jgi:hypothetical protein
MLRCPAVLDLPADGDAVVALVAMQDIAGGHPREKLRLGEPCNPQPGRQ